MPELPDISAYIAALDARIRGRLLERVQVHNPFFLRSVEPRPEALHGRSVTAVSRLGKRVAIHLADEYAIVFHLMIAGRFHWFERDDNRKATRQTLIELLFDNGRLTLTEAGKKRRASMHVVQGTEALRAHDPGGLEVLHASADEFAARLQLENRTLKRALTDPRILSGIGNAYSDEILHAARLSPVTLTSRLNDEQLQRLFDATTTVLRQWQSRLVGEALQAFPEKVTAFRPEMAVHGRFGQPCPECGTAVQRIRYASNETNYCPKCQTGGKLLADRALSRLLKKDWPRSIDEL